MQYQPSDDCPHVPGDDFLWQESDCTWFADLEKGPGKNLVGFYRVGQHPQTNEGAVLLFIATDGGDQFRHVIRAKDGTRDDTSQQVAGCSATSLGDKKMRYGWHAEKCQGDITFTESFYDPRGWAQDDSAAGLNNTINDQGHLEVSGRMHGTITLNGTRYDINALAHRDRSWGVRNIAMVAQHRMSTGTFGPKLSWASTQLQLPTGPFHTAGFVVREGTQEDIASVDIVAHVAADGISVLGGTTRLTLKSGEVIEIACETIGSFGHVYGESYLTTENLSRADCQGMTGFCDLETSINGQHGVHVPTQTGVQYAMMENGFRQVGAAR